MLNIAEIERLDDPRIAAYAGLTRAQLQNRQHPQEGLFICESVPVIEAALFAGYEPVSFLMERRKIDLLADLLLARCPDAPVYTAERETLKDLTGYALTRGVLCAMRRKPLPEYTSVCREARRIAVLENITDTTNMGAIFRSAAALGMDAVLLTPSCCDPFARRSLRVSMGGVFRVPLAYLPQEDPIGALRALGFACAALALDERAVPVTDPGLRGYEKLALVLGTEGTGLLPETIARCDAAVIIPMHNGVDSLNVAAAAAVAFWEIGKARPGETP